MNGRRAKAIRRARRKLHEEAARKPINPAALTQARLELERLRKPRTPIKGATR
jgi:hypothetical protein